MDHENDLVITIAVNGQQTFQRRMTINYGRWQRGIGSLVQQKIRHLQTIFILECRL